MKLAAVKGDITVFSADVIVNAANSELAGGGGVDGAIHRAAGPTVMAELNEIRRAIGHCATGSAVITGAGRLWAQYIVHAVGPVYQGGAAGESRLLASCYRESLCLAAEKCAKTVGFPAISAGIYGYPMAEASQVAVAAVKEFLPNPGTIELVTFVLFSDEALAAFERALS